MVGRRLTRPDAAHPTLTLVRTLTVDWSTESPNREESRGERVAVNESRVFGVAVGFRTS